jgi:hypothetical protein
VRGGALLVEPRRQADRVIERQPEQLLAQAVDPRHTREHRQCHPRHRLPESRHHEVVRTFGVERKERGTHRPRVETHVA